MTVPPRADAGTFRSEERSWLKARRDDRTPAELREMPNQALSALGQREIIDQYQHISADLPEEPILIGRSAGGVFVQHLLDRGIGVAGVVIDPR